MSDSSAGRMVRALRHRNYRLYFTGHFLSQAGSWITRVATSWLAYRLTGSELLLGLVAFAGQIPTLLLAPIGGVISDRWNRRTILVVAQVGFAVQSLALALLTMTGRITPAQLIVLQLVHGVIKSLETPARQAFVAEMVNDPADLPNAIALNSAIFNGARIIGPTIAGMVIAAAGEAWCFLIDAVSYVAVIFSILAMRFTTSPHRHGGKNLLQDLGAGLRYVWSFPPARALLSQVALVSIMGMPYIVLMPVVAARVLHGGPRALGILMAATGIGALFSTFYLASRRSVLGLSRVIVAATVTLSLGLIAFSFSRSLLLSAAILPFVGAGVVLQLASANTILQTVVDDRLRGRVMAFFTMATFGAQPVGSLAAGALAERIGTQRTILAGALVCLAGAGWFALQRPRLAAHIRPIYAQRGILEEDVSPPAERA